MQYKYTADNGKRIPKQCSSQSRLVYRYLQQHGLTKLFSNISYVYLNKHLKCFQNCFSRKKRVKKFCLVSNV